MPTGLTTKTVADDDWLLEFCNFREAWALSPPRSDSKSKGEGVTVVQLDTGYTAHPELLQDSRYQVGPAYSRDFLKSGGLLTAPSLDGRDDLTGPSSSHGTKTAGVLISAEGSPDPVVFPAYAATHAVHGVAPMAELIPYRVTKWVNLTDATGIALARAIYYALGTLDTDRIGVMSISLGRSSIGAIEGKDAITNALRAARKRGVVICAAAGQLQMDSQSGEILASRLGPAFPASNPNVICCAGCRVDHSPIVSGFLGPEVDITAPAFDLWVPGTTTTSPVFDVFQSWGTSYATAIVAGTCALWQAHHGREFLLDPANYGPELIFTLFKEMLRRSAHRPAGWDATNRGVGVIDAEALLAAWLPSKSEIESIDGGG